MTRNSDASFSESFACLPTPMYPKHTMKSFLMLLGIGAIFAAATACVLPGAKKEKKSPAQNSAPAAESRY